MVKPANTLLLLLALMALLKDVTRCEAYRGLQRPHMDYRHKAMMRLHSVESDERIVKEGGGGGMEEGDDLIDSPTEAPVPSEHVAEEEPEYTRNYGTSSL